MVNPIPSQIVNLSDLPKELQKRGRAGSKYDEMFAAVEKGEIRAVPYTKDTDAGNIYSALRQRITKDKLSMALVRDTKNKRVFLMQLEVFNKKYPKK